MAYHKLAASAFSMVPSEAFKPHLSLYYGLREERERNVMITTLPEYVGETIAIDSVSVYRTPGIVATWEKVAEFPLRGVSVK